MSHSQSLILITVDCLRADHTGLFGYERPTTPFLNELSTECLLFRNAVVAGSPTYYSFPSIMASRHPLALGRDIVGLAPNEPTIATALSEAGYATAAFIAGNPYLSDRFGYEAAFGTFQDFLETKGAPLMDGSCQTEEPSKRTRFNRRLAKLCHDLGPIGRLYDELYFRYGLRVANRSAVSFDSLRRFPSAEVLVDHACNWLQGIGHRPFFLWLHFMDPHSPYYPPVEALRLMGDSQLDAPRAQYLNSLWNRGDLGTTRLHRHRDEIVALYDAGVRWVDAQTSRLVSVFRQAGRWDNCVLAFTADHGEEFLEHGGRYHPPSRVTEELVHVPLLVRVPGLRTTNPVQSPFSALDLAPTLLEIMSVQRPSSFAGRSRWERIRADKGWEDAAVIECVANCANPFHRQNRLGSRILCVREQQYKLVLDFTSMNETLFDLAVDPEELHPLPPAVQKAVRARLLKCALRHLANGMESRNEDDRLTAYLRDLRLDSVA